MTIASGQGETSTGALLIQENIQDDPLWIDLSLKTALLKIKFGGESEYSFEPAAFDLFIQKSNFLLV
jgi:hypothetical protein